MMFRRSIIVIVSVLSLSSSVALAQERDVAAEAARDMQLGMQGLKQAGEDPALLAQLMKDMQDPEMMEAAKAMMSNPEWQKQMKDFTSNKEFKDSIKKTQEMLKDPNLAAKTEAKMEHMLKVGNDQLQKGAAAAMEQAMDAMSNPEFVGEMAKMVKDPAFTKQLESMAKDPNFKTYMDAMQEMLKDPEKKKKIEAATQSLKTKM